MPAPAGVGAPGYRTLAEAGRWVEATEQPSVKLLGSEAVQGAVLRVLDALSPRVRPRSSERSGPPLTGEGLAASWWERFVRRFAGTIVGGASQIQRNIIAERVLGLPR